MGQAVRSLLGPFCASPASGRITSSNAAACPSRFWRGLDFTRTLRRGVWAFLTRPRPPLFYGDRMA